MSSATYAPPVGTLRTASRPLAARRRLFVVIALVMLAFAVMVAIDRGGAQAGLEDRVAGHVVVQPGESLWDIAVATAPDGIDPRQQLADLQELNGIRDAHVDQWTVVLVPAR